MFGGREQNYVRAVTSVEQQVRVLREHDSLIDTPVVSIWSLSGNLHTTENIRRLDDANSDYKQNLVKYWA